ncbi:hypothetical protein TB1_009400 [Malus domestica]
MPYSLKLRNSFSNSIPQKKSDILLMGVPSPSHSFCSILFNITVNLSMEILSHSRNWSMYLSQVLMKFPGQSSSSPSRLSSTKSNTQPEDLRPSHCLERKLMRAAGIVGRSRRIRWITPSGT